MLICQYSVYVRNRPWPPFFFFPLKSLVVSNIKGNFLLKMVRWNRRHFY